MAIYTKIGDKGTSLIKGEKIPKDSLLFEVLGSVDELISFLGLARTEAPAEDKREILTIQKDLLKLNSLICGFKGKFSQEKVNRLEKKIDQTMKAKSRIKTFVIPGENEYSALLHIARTVARRAERKAVALNKESRINPIILAYLNRLSDYLFALSL